MRYSYLFPAVVAMLSTTPSVTLAQEFHANLRAQFGVTDADYPGCHGRMLAFVGGSVELGQPLFIEILGEKMGAGGDACLPVRQTSNPDQPFAAAVLTEPTSRGSLGVGRRFANQHFSAAVRVGRFLNTAEGFVSGNVSLRLFVFTAGFEVGQVNGRWTFEDGTTYRRWSTFGGFSLGLRI